MSELKAYNVVATADVNPEVVDILGCTEWAAYDKNEVDAAITELKARIHELESMPHTDNSAVIERLSNENERLVKCCKEYDSRKRIDERIKFNGAQQIRATKRALWLARASMCRNYDIRSYFIDRIDSKRRFAEFAMLMQKAAATAEIKAKEFE